MRFSRLFTSLLPAVIAFAFPVFAHADKDIRQVVATIAPIHSLVQMVLGETTDADLLVSNGASVHDFHLKPSQRKLILKADLVFMIDPHFETFLQKQTGINGFVSLSKSADIDLLEKRKNEHWGEHHHSHGLDVHTAHPVDYHVWLNPLNALKMVESIKLSLISAYPEDAEVFEKNALDAKDSLTSLDRNLQVLLEPIKEQPYIVFHDAYGYFESRYGLNGVGSILLNPEVPPSAKQITYIRQKIRDSNAVCVFSEKQFSDKLVDTVTEGIEINRAVLDPLGAAQNTVGNTYAYAETVQTLASTIADCLSDRKDN